MKIAIFGPPGSGKGTQAYQLKQTCGMAHLSTGDLLRQVAKEAGPLGDQVRAIPTGTFASDELIIELLKRELDNPAYQNGVILDGFPRTVAQVHKMTEMGLAIDLAIELELDNPGILRARLTNRCSHPASGRIYNSQTNPPQASGIDDLTGEPLLFRDDDGPAFVSRRLADWQDKTQPAVREFQTLGTTMWLKVDGQDDVDSLHEDLVLGIAFATALNFNPQEGVIRVSHGNILTSKEEKDEEDLIDNDNLSSEEIDALGFETEPASAPVKPVRLGA